MACGLCGRSGHNKRTCPMPDTKTKTKTKTKTEYRNAECNRHYCFCKTKTVVFGIAKRSETCVWIDEHKVETNHNKKNLPITKQMLDDLMDAVTEFWIEWNYSAYHFGREEYLGDYDDL